MKRLAKEMVKLAKHCPEGVVCYPLNEDITNLEAKIQPMQGTPYEQGLFTLSIVCGERYPNEPPNVRFVTPIYHPNIDSEGRICLNLLKMPPKGVWTPSYDICALLSGIQILLAQPNPDDPLMTEITDEYTSNYDVFLRKAREATKKYAMDQTKVLVGKENQTERPPEKEKEDEEVQDVLDEDNETKKREKSPSVCSDDEDEIQEKLVAKKIRL